MDQDEFERRKRAVEEQLHADIEVLRAAAQLKIGALEALWLASRAQDLQDAPRDTLAFASAVSQARTPPPAKPQPTAQRPKKAPAQPPARHAYQGGMHDILDTFPQLPEVFDKSDVIRILGFEPSRPAFHRAWNRLVFQEKIVMESPSYGRESLRFRKLKPK